MLKFSYYITDVMDKAWFDSSNVIYGECDESDTQNKTVRIVFKNGATYQYDDVLVADWVSLKNANSQGTALNELFKKGGYKYKRIEDRNVEDIEKEYLERRGCDFVFKKDNDKLNILTNKEVLVYSMDYPGDDITNNIKELLEKINYVVMVQDNEK